jgi:glycosyltransferase involved in cell wall biosynthesis
LQGLLERPSHSREFNTDYPRQFDKLNFTLTRRLSRKHRQWADSVMGRLREFLHRPAQSKGTLLAQHVSELRRLREACFELWLESLADGLAVVNLPQYGYAYGTRVVEAIAAGAPIIAHRIAGRPATEALYENGKEILLYETPEELAEHLRRLQSDPALRTRLARAAQARLLESHTTEKRVREFLHWLDIL